MTLTLSETASTVVKAIADQSAVATTGGLRISGAEGGNSDFDIAVVPDAENNDTIVENDGARVFLDTNAAAALSQAVLDAKVGDDGSISFSVGSEA